MSGQTPIERDRSYRASFSPYPEAAFRTSSIWLALSYRVAYYLSRFFPVMIGRIMLSLRKAADRPLGNWSLAELSANDRSVQSSIMFHRPRRSLHRRRDSILFDTVSGSQAATQ